MRRRQTIRMCRAGENPPTPIRVDLSDANNPQTDSLIVSLNVFMSDHDNTQLDAISTGDHFGIADANAGQSDSLIVRLPNVMLVDSNGTPIDSLSVQHRVQLVDSNALPTDSLVVTVTHPPFDPSTLPLTGYVRGSFSQPFTTTTPSAGTSGINTPFRAVILDSTLGTPVDGFAPLEWLAFDQNRTFWDNVAGSYRPCSSLFTRSLGSWVILFKPASLSAPNNTPGSEDNNPCALSVTIGGFMGIALTLSTSGARGVWDDIGANQFTVPSAPATWVPGPTVGQWSCLGLRWDLGANLMTLSVGGTVVSAPFPNLIRNTDAQRLSVLENLLWGPVQPGDIMEVLTSDQYLTDANIVDYRTSYVPSRYPSMNPV